MLAAVLGDLFCQILLQTGIDFSELEEAETKNHEQPRRVNMSSVGLDLADIQKADLGDEIICDQGFENSICSSVLCATRPMLPLISLLFFDATLDA